MAQNWLLSPLPWPKWDQILQNVCQKNKLDKSYHWTPNFLHLDWNWSCSVCIPWIFEWICASLQENRTISSICPPMHFYNANLVPSDQADHGLSLDITFSMIDSCVVELHPTFEFLLANWAENFVLKLVLMFLSNSSKWTCAIKAKFGVMFNLIIYEVFAHNLHFIEYAWCWCQLKNLQFCMHLSLLGSLLAVACRNFILQEANFFQKNQHHKYLFL